MGHTTVTRASLALAALFAAASLLFAWIASREARDTPPRGSRSSPDAPSDGAALFRRYCASCHTTSEMTELLRQAPDLEAAAAEMLELLADHGASSDAEDRAIVEHLRATSGER